MVNLQTSIEAGLVIREVKLEAAAKAKIDELTRIRLGIAPGFAPSGGQLATTAAAMGKAGIGGQTGLMGMAASLTTLVSSITGLASIIMLAISNSKIIAMLSGTIGKALGLLVDVILMPFLPIFMIILVGLFKAIMVFYQWWKGIISPDVIKAIEDIGAGLKKGLEFLWSITIGAFAEGVKEIWDGLMWIKGILENSGGITGITVTIGNTINDFLEWIRTGFTTFIINIIERRTPEPGFGGSGGFGGGGALGSSQYQPFIDLLQNLGLMGFGYSPTVFGGSDSGSGGRSGNVVELAGGGTITKTGLAKVHKGETIGKGGITVNITGQFKTDEEMYKRFVDRLRQEQWRTNV